MEPTTRTSLILLHGALGSAEQLSPLAAQLRSHFDVHVMDFPGHGDEPLGDQPFAFSAFVASVRDYINQQQLKQPLLFGHSMGGMVALLLALEKDCPLRGVITLGTKLGWTAEVAAREVGMMNPDKIEQKVPAFARALEQRHRALDWRRLLEYTQAFTSALGEQPPRLGEWLPGVSVPVFFGVAERDHLVPHEEAQRVVAHLPQGTFWTMAGAHPLESVEVDALAARIRDFAFPSSASRHGRRERKTPQQP